jgi:hypothetical protein
MSRSAARHFARALATCALAMGVIVSAVPVTAQSVSYDTAYFRGLSFRNVGPVRGGRSLAVAGSSTRPFE